MEDIVAVAVELESGETEYCLTWGRIQAAVDARPLEKLILGVYKDRQSENGSSPVATRLCSSLQEASSCGNFYECLFGMSQERIPFERKTFVSWRKRKKQRMKEGRDIWFLTS